MKMAKAILTCFAGSCTPAFVAFLEAGESWTRYVFAAGLTRLNGPGGGSVAVGLLSSSFCKHTALMTCHYRSD